MSYKRKNPNRKPIVFFILTGIGFVSLIIASINLLQNDLIVFSSDEESTFEITEKGEYYILLDTDGVRYSSEVENIGVSINLTLTSQDEEEVFKSSLLLNTESDTSATSINNIEFDKQIRHRGYLGFGKVDLKADTYSFNGVVVKNTEDFGQYALLSMNYVNRIGLFSLSAILTLLFALLGFKYFKEAKKIPLSKYQRKHIKG